MCTAFYFLVSHYTESIFLSRRKRGANTFILTNGNLLTEMPDPSPPLYIIHKTHLKKMMVEIFAEKMVHMVALCQRRRRKKRGYFKSPHGAVEQLLVCAPMQPMHFSRYCYVCAVCVGYVGDGNQTLYLCRSNICF